MCYSVGSVGCVTAVQVVSSVTVCVGRVAAVQVVPRNLAVDMGGAVVAVPDMVLVAVARTMADVVACVRVVIAAVCKVVEC